MKIDKKIKDLLWGKFSERTEQNKSLILDLVTEPKRIVFRMKGAARGGGCKKHG